jgi:hypothetical protein
LAALLWANTSRQVHLDYLLAGSAGVNDYDFSSAIILITLLFEKTI